jgi:hypothetical protein
MINLKDILNEGIFSKKKKSKKIIRPTTLKKRGYNDHRYKGLTYDYSDTAKLNDFSIWASHFPDTDEYFIYIPNSKEAKKNMQTSVSKEEFEKFLKGFKLK